MSSFAVQGYQVWPAVVPRADCDELLARARELVAASRSQTAFCPETHDHDNDPTFLASAAGIEVFWESDGRTPNKLGHAMHDLDPMFSAFARQPAIRRAVQETGVADPLLVQSMLIFKEPGQGGAVPAHQDATYLRTEPHSVVGVWVPLVDADRDNGTLEVLAGGQGEALREDYIRRGDEVLTEARDTTPFPEEGWTPVEVPAGSVVVFHGLLPHRSAANRSGRGRAAFTLHAVSAAASWRADNWLRRPPELPFRGF